MYIFEKRISLENRNELKEYMDSFDYGASSFSFTSLFMWKESNEFSYQIIGEYLCIAALSHLEIDNGVHFMLPPLTKDGTYNRESLRDTIIKAKSIFESKGADFSLRLVPEHMVEILNEALPEIDFEEDISNHEYIYSRNELEELKGKKYHAKKNYVNSFKKNYQFEYEDIIPSLTDEIMEYIHDFTERKVLDEYDKGLLVMEEKAMRDVFENFDKAGYIGGLIRIDGKIQALAAGGRLGENMFIEHIEKANTDFRGLYPVIMNELIKRLPKEVSLFNREEDMGMENLRKAKLSYHPVSLLKMYIGIF